MASCGFPGNSDMYGLGIRLGFYLNWYGSTLASWIARDELDGMELSNSFFVAATFLALIIQTARDNLKTVEIYIVLLLTFGGYLYLVPLYFWRILTCWAPQWDPSRFPRVPVRIVFSTLNWFLLVAVAVFQLWFWITKVPALVETGECREFGFLFTKVPLTGKGFIVANVLLYFFLLLCSVGSLCFGWIVSRPEKEEKAQIPKRIRLLALQQLNSLISLGVASTIVAATELTIIWNGIEGINEISAAGQTIPLVIAVGLLVRVIYVALFIGDEDPEKYDFHRRRHPKDDNGGTPRDPRQPADAGRLPPRYRLPPVGPHNIPPLPPPRNLRQPDDGGRLPRRNPERPGPPGALR